MNIQRKIECKDQESTQSSTTPDPGHQWEGDSFTIRHHQREPRGQPFPSRRPQGINKQTHESITKQERNNINDPQKKYRLGTVSKNIFTGKLKLVSRRANLTLSSDVDQDT